MDLSYVGSAAHKLFVNEELNPIRRRRLHRNAAAGLQQSGGNSACAVERLAHHYIRAGDYENGLIYAKRAAAEAERVFAIDEVVAAYGHARDCAEALGLVEEQLSLEEAIGKTYLLHGDMIPAGEHFERAMALTTDPHVRARLQTEAATSLVATGDQRGIEYLHEALKFLDPVKEPVATANALSNEARFHHLAGRHRDAIELLTRAADLVAPTAAADEVSSFAAPIISNGASTPPEVPEPREIIQIVAFTSRTPVISVFDTSPLSSVSITS